MPAIDYQDVLDEILDQLKVEGQALAAKYRKKLEEYADATRSILIDLKDETITADEARVAARQIFNATKSTLISGAYDAKRSFVASLLAAAQTALTILIKLVATA